MSKTHSIVAAGFGGQGMLFAGRQLALTGMYLDKNVTWLPSYGAESRGGTSNCTVIISDDPIGAPVVKNHNIAMVMNVPSFLKFGALLQKDGYLFCDSSLVPEKCARDDIKCFYIPATSIADKELGTTKSANVVMLGKLIKETGLFTADEMIMAMEKSMPHKELIDMNIKALKLGFDYAE
jgi:2-oxoglutarate ferredoxin oxidoreductase subunit gamma